MRGRGQRTFAAVPEVPLLEPETEVLRTHPVPLFLLKSLLS
jgi:hypothetical protein